MPSASTAASGAASPPARRSRRWAASGPRRAGRVIARHLDELDAAEARVNEIYFAWKVGTPTELDAELDAMLARWRAVPDGGDLPLTWRIDRTRRRA